MLHDASGGMRLSDCDAGTAARRAGSSRDRHRRAPRDFGPLSLSHRPAQAAVRGFSISGRALSIKRFGTRGEALFSPAGSDSVKCSSAPRRSLEVARLGIALSILAYMFEASSVSSYAEMRWSRVPRSYIGGGSKP